MRGADDAFVLLTVDSMGRCQSGLNLLTRTTAATVDLGVGSGVTVGNLTHLLLATLSLQQACICHRSARTAKFREHRNGALALHVTSPVCPQAL